MPMISLLFSLSGEKKTRCSVTERTVAIDVGAAAFTVARVVESMDSVERHSTCVTLKNAKWFARIAQPLGGLLEEVGEEVQEPLYE